MTKELQGIRLQGVGLMLLFIGLSQDPLVVYILIMAINHVTSCSKQSSTSEDWGKETVFSPIIIAFLVTISNFSTRGIDSIKIICQLFKDHFLSFMHYESFGESERQVFRTAAEKTFDIFDDAM